MNEDTRAHKFKKLVTQEEPQEENKNEQKPQEKNHKKSQLTPKIIIVSIILIIILLLSYANFIEPKMIVVNEHKINTTLIPNSMNGLKIVHFSDIHYGTTITKKEFDKIINKINEIKPDIIFFTGDLIDKNANISEEEQNNIINALSSLKPNLYKYAIYGDEDVDNKQFKHIIESSGFKLLDNENTLLFYEDNTPIEIVGFNIISNNPNYTILTNYIDNQETTNYYKIVLVHEPDSIDNFINYDSNLILAGDTLGGLIKLPLFKPLFLNEHSQKYYKEYYNINGTDIYISNGLGTSYINARLNNAPSINFYRLNKVE